MSGTMKMLSRSNYCEEIFLLGCDVLVTLLHLRRPRLHSGAEGRQDAQTVPGCPTPHPLLLLPQKIPTTSLPNSPTAQLPTMFLECAALGIQRLQGERWNRREWRWKGAADSVCEKMNMLITKFSTLKLTPLSSHRFLGHNSDLGTFIWLNGLLLGVYSFIGDNTGSEVYSR